MAHDHSPPFCRAGHLPGGPPAVQAKALADTCSGRALERKSALDAESEKLQTVTANSAINVPGRWGQAAGCPPPPARWRASPEQAEALGRSRSTRGALPWHGGRPRLFRAVNGRSGCSPHVDKAGSRLPRNCRVLGAGSQRGWGTSGRSGAVQRIPGGRGLSRAASGALHSDRAQGRPAVPPRPAAGSHALGPSLRGSPGC